MSSHSPGAMHAAKVIVDARQTIWTADGEKSVGELADLIEEKTRIVELIDATEGLLRSVKTDTASLESTENEPSRPVSSKRIDELERTLTAVLERAAAGAGGRTDTH